MAKRELQRVQQLRLGKGTDQEMGGAVAMQDFERVAVVARQQDEQSGGIGLDGVADRPNRLLPLLERAARIDQGDGGARRDEARLGIFGAARRDRLPAGALGQPGQLVAMAEGQYEQGRHRQSLATRPGLRQSPLRGNPGLVH